MAFIDISYDGGPTYDDNDNRIENPVLYEKVGLRVISGKFDFDSGDFVKD